MSDNTKMEMPMSKVLNGREVLALLAQDDAPEIEYLNRVTGKWKKAHINDWCITEWRTTSLKYRIKPNPASRLSATIEGGEVVSWPEPVREPLKDGQKYWYVDSWGIVNCLTWDSHEGNNYYLTFGNIHLTREAAQEHADALRKINTQGVV